MPRATLILSFFNRIDYLKLVLAGIQRQSFRDIEIIIADDGSKQAVVDEIEKLTKMISIPLIHLWQEDRGFRKNKILNRAITAASSDYLIFIDADCIPHSEFVNEHFSHRKENVCLTGRRVNLSEKITGLLNEENIGKGFLEENIFLLVKDGIFGKSFDVEKGFYIKNGPVRKLLNNKARGILGCNFSIHKTDFININGFDERYEAPSIGEDSDVQFRFELNGAKIKSLNNAAVQYHLFHKLQERPLKNLELFSKIKSEKRPFTPFGILQ